MESAVLEELLKALEVDVGEARLEELLGLNIGRELLVKLHSRWKGGGMRADTERGLMAVGWSGWMAENQKHAERMDI